MLETLSLSHRRSLKGKIHWWCLKYWLRLFEFGLYDVFVCFFLPTSAFYTFLMHTPNVRFTQYILLAQFNIFIDANETIAPKFLFSYTFHSKHQNTKREQNEAEAGRKKISFEMAFFWCFWGFFLLLFFVVYVYLHGNEKKGISSISFIKQSLCHFRSLARSLSPERFLFKFISSLIDWQPKEE